MRAAFTLIEVLAAVFLTAVVMTVAISFFVTLSDSADAAAHKARQGRQALAVLDRVASDLEGAYLLAKPPEVDPLFHPWMFVAESQEGDSTSDRVHFVTRSYRPRNPLAHGSDLAVITYLLHPADDAPGFELLRSVVPGLPADAERDFPSASDERFMVVAEGIDHFGLSFLGEDFEWYDAWDSTQLEQSAALPQAVEIEIAYLPELPPGAPASEDSGGIDREEGEVESFSRRVRLPMHAVDLDTMLATVRGEAAEDAAQDDQDQDQNQDQDDNQDLTDALESLEGLDLPEGFDPEQLKQELSR